MTPEDETRLRQLYQNLEQVEIAPTDPRYVPLQDHSTSFGPDVVKELVRDVAWTSEGSAFFLSGLRGSGKSSQLLRLRQDLSDSGFAAVRLDAEDYLNLRQPVDVVDFLFFLVGGIADAIEDEGWLPADSAGARAWDRLSTWLQGLPARISVTPQAELGAGADAGFVSGKASLKAELRKDASFVAQLRHFLEGRLSELTSEANDIVSELVDELRKVWLEQTGFEWKGLVVLVDSLDHVRGADFGQVRRALVDLLDKQSATIKLAACRTVYIVPPWVHVDYAPIRRLANVKVAEIDGQVFGDGYISLEQVLAQRCPEDSQLGDFLRPETVRQLIRDSGGHLRDLLRLVRGASVAADELPFSDAAVARGRQELRDGLLPLADDERQCLRQVADNHEVPLPTQDDWETLAGLFDRHLVLGYKNGETWYDVHPLIADELG